MFQAITLTGSSHEPRLTPEEVDAFARFAYSVHEHSAETPAEPIFWIRVDGDLSHYWN